MKTRNRYMTIMAVMTTLVVIFAAFVWWRQPPAAPVIGPSESSTTPGAESKRTIHYPIQLNDDKLVESGPLPALQESDPVVGKALTKLLGQYWFEEVFRLQETIRHIVVTIDNLPRASVAARLLPVNPPEGQFRAVVSSEGMAIAPENAGRYKAFIQVAEMLDAKKLVETYRQFYPLFQLAYRDLGYPNGYFNDRLVIVIDHLLEAPEPSDAVGLLQPHILYQFADPELEAESAGHKIMMRIGKENELKIKAKLREIRHELVAVG